MLLGFALVSYVTTLVSCAEYPGELKDYVFQDSSPLRGLDLGTRDFHLLEAGQFVNGTDAGAMEDLAFEPPSNLIAETNLGHKLDGRNLFPRGTCITSLLVGNPWLIT